MLNKNSNVLQVETKNYGECGYCYQAEKEILNVPWGIWSQWVFISQSMGDTEWGGVFWLTGNTVTSFKIPAQEVTGTECEFKEELGGDGLVHSHHNMSAAHSSQDDHHARNLYDYSIVLSNRGYEATKRIKLPCGGFGYIRVELRLTDCPDVDLTKVNLKEQKPETLTPSPQQLPADDYEEWDVSDLMDMPVPCSQERR